MGKFQELLVWKRAKDLAVYVYKVTGKGAITKDFGFRDQIRRAAVSIPSNIAEGDELGSNKQAIKFFFIAKGSSAELLTQSIPPFTLYLRPCTLYLAPGFYYASFPVKCARRTSPPQRLADKSASLQFYELFNGARMPENDPVSLGELCRTCMSENKGKTIKVQVNGATANGR
jgi:hypothetical protein